MPAPTFHIARIYRIDANNQNEVLEFDSGVNILLGRSNTGKSTWLELIDYVLGKDRTPALFAADAKPPYTPRYTEAGIYYTTAEHTRHICRIFADGVDQNPIYLDGVRVQPVELQRKILADLDIPIVRYPRGNPYQPRSWAELRFRSLFRHTYRQQRFWNDVVDKQYSSEFTACFLQFCGLAQTVYNDAFAEFIEYSSKREKLSAQYDQYQKTLDSFAEQTFEELPLVNGVSEATIEESLQNLQIDADALLEHRKERLYQLADGITEEDLQTTQKLLKEKSKLTSEYDSCTNEIQACELYIQEVYNFRKTLLDEEVQLRRAVVSASVLAPYKVVQCPNCEQDLKAKLEESTDTGQCYVCNQALTERPGDYSVAKERVSYELRRIKSEVAECDEILDKKRKELEKLRERAARLSSSMVHIDRRVAGFQAFEGATTDDGLISIDQSYGQTIEKMRQVSSLYSSLEKLKGINVEIRESERLADEKREEVDRRLEDVDFNEPARMLSLAMNYYLSRINKLRPKTWLHDPVYVHLNEDYVSFRVGRRQWFSVLGATDRLYFFMAYQYGLLVLSGKIENSNYPRVSIIDLPAEFRGEVVTSRESYVVIPFVELITQKPDWNLQIILAGSSIKGVEGANYITMRNTYTGR